MITRDYPNASEGDLRVDGIGVYNQYGTARLVVFNARNATVLPAIADPPQLIRYPRLKPTGPYHVAGQGQDYDCWEFSDAGWHDRGNGSGVSPVIYDGANVLHIIEPAPNQTSQGYRCLDQAGTPVLGDATLSIATVPNGRLLHEYTPIATPQGLILIGQDHISGTHIVFQGVRYILDTGDCQVIRAAWSASDGLAVIVTHYPLHIARVFLFTIAEIRSLKVFDDTVPQPVVPPKFTISEPTFPPEGITGQVPFSLRCVYADERGGGPVEWMDWLLGSSPNGPWVVNAHNPGWDVDHTFRFSTAGTYYIKARGSNAAGTHETGAVRRTNVLPVNRPPDPPHGTEFRLRTVFGGYLKVGPDLFLREEAQGDRFSIVDSNRPGFIGLQVKGKFVATEPDGRLKADRDTCSDWEYFARFLPAPDQWQFLSDAWKLYISAHGDGVVLADQPVASTWETFTAEPVTGGEIAGPIHVDGPIFRTPDNAPWRIRGVTAFKLARLFADGADIRPFLSYFRDLGANTLRVWPYVPWPDIGWVSPSNDDIIQFIRFVRSEGFYTYLTLLTSDEDHYIPWAQRLVQDLTAAQLDSLFLEAGNEPRVHKNINVHALKAVLDASGYLYTSGEYDDVAIWFGRVMDEHPQRDSEWVRRGHDLLEYYQGAPHYEGEPTAGVPSFAGEPNRADLAGFNANDALAAFAVFGLLGAGGFVHYQNGEYGQLPDVAETGFVEAAFEGLLALPADVWFSGPYERIDENGGTLRTYKRGPYIVRIRPQSGPILIGPGAATMERVNLSVTDPMRYEFTTTHALTDADEERVLGLLRADGVNGPIRIGQINHEDPLHWFIECEQNPNVARHF